MKRMRTAAVMAFVTLAVPSSALSQEANSNGWGGRGFVTFNVGAQTASQGFAYDFTTTLFEETAKAGLDVPGTTGLSLDVGAGLRLVQNLGIGVTYSRYSNERTATLTTTIPSPFFYDDASAISEQMPLQREENAVHIQAIYRVPIGGRIQIGGFGGPSYFRCIDDHITDFSLDPALSQDMDWSVAFRDITQLVDRSSAWGYHGGATFTYLAARHVGVGMTVRYSHASHTTMNHFSDVSSLAPEGIWGGNDGTVSVTMNHGGFQWHGGVSIHF